MGGLVVSPGTIRWSAGTVTVEFTGDGHARFLPWEMRPSPFPSISIRRVATGQVSVRNTSDRTIVGQAVPSVAPRGTAAQHFG